MWLILSFLRRRGADIVAVLFILFCLITLTGPVVRAQIDRNGRCVYNVGRIATGLSSYMTDYDDVVPYTMNNYAALQRVLSPYVRDTTVYRCPCTQNSPYTPAAALANKPLSSFSNLDKTEVLRDSKVHPDGKFTIAFADGHVEHGGIDQTLPLPDTTCYNRVLRLAKALKMYAQDYDGVYPVYQNNTAFHNALQPYVRSPHSWICPDSNRYYSFSKDIRGKTDLDFPDLSPVIVVEDPVVHKSGVKTTAYLDGYHEQRGPNGVNFQSPSNLSFNRLRRIARAYVSYIKDHNNRLPVYSSYDDLVTKLFPYIRASRTFQSPGDQPFEANVALSGTLLSDYRDPRSVIILQDPNKYNPVYITVAYLDGSVGSIMP